MIELEIQTLSQTREGLLVEVGRAVTASGFTLVRQRLSDDPHGTLMSMVVRGPPRRQRALEAALDAIERVISFELSAFLAGEPKPHFAASRRVATVSSPRTATPVSAAAAAAAPVTATAAVAPTAPATPAATMPSGPAADDVIAAAPGAATEAAHPDASPAAAPAAIPLPPAGTAERQDPPAPEPFLDVLMPLPPAPPAPAPPAPLPLVEVTPMEADALAVDEALVSVVRDYPRIMTHLLALDRKVAPGARESSLTLAGRRAGEWVRERDYASHGHLDLPQAIAAIAVPALRALVAVEQRGMQVQIRDSPLCTEDGRSGCDFYSGFLQGLLGPAPGSDALNIFPVCCRSYGADDCVLDLSG